MRSCFPLVVVALFAAAAAGAEEFESWQDALDGGWAKARAEPPAVERSPDAPEAAPPLVRFGAGAAYLVALRPADLARGERLMSEFSIGFSPLRWLFELGADLDLSRDGRFFLRPNLRLLLMDRLEFSFFVEGSLALYSHPGGVELGYGAALGGSVGLLENLALECYAAAMVFDLDPEAASGLVGAGTLGEAPGSSSRIVLPSAGARLMARF